MAKISLETNNQHPNGELLSDNSKWGDLGNVSDEKELEAYINCWLTAGCIVKTTDTLVLGDVPFALHTFWEQVKPNKKTPPPFALLTELRYDGTTSTKFFQFTLVPKNDSITYRQLRIATGKIKLLLPQRI
ncbi:hypothetical protein A2210_01395 [Candidatus Woesebacteria bacterium RIFOXYA1_FULL_40_18]|uniref:Uncharacterized protein n=3 Tax=Candidatus Woeseibacteriota TaxID=1752722 RepID=A0A1F8CHX6_9BACT|nr:MAG: hypothetical protein A2210_01395 [Candidatus Woesebacteria bacterium RIFOXYA1_FULL_40_18]OGM80354.1 MAG: hypothetical protein A2361_02840 [Candidatus Woesebacteria bacterium RIFOXYB1_FULL_40_26]OGM86785.1 MAG: hypothetical protein A2614_00210 [Candidatus Woesebacteria bacterium RIFOXYD1_FULL_40_21]